MNILNNDLDIELEFESTRNEKKNSCRSRQTIGVIATLNQKVNLF